MLLPLMFCVACGSTTVLRSAAPCSSLVPSEWKEGVDGAPLPSNDDKESWREFGLKQTGQLNQSNGRTRDSLTIISGCEERDRQATRSVPWWQFWR
jgi:hypothetical protein